MATMRDSMNRVWQRLGAMTLPSRLLIAALVVVAILSLMLVATNAAKPTFVELLPGLTPDQVAKAKSKLEELRVPFRAENGRILIAPDQKHFALALLQEGGGLPADTGPLFSNLASSQNWMNTKSQNDQITNLATQNELALVISKMRGIKSAKVFIDAPEATGLGSTAKRPTASVMLITDSTLPFDQNRANAVAAAVTGVKAGLKITDVKIIDQVTGRAWSGKGSDEMSGSDYIDAVARFESMLREKLRDSLGYIPNAIVTVTAQLDNTRRSYTESRILADGAGSVLVNARTEKTSRKDSTATTAAEPGARVNVGTSLNEGAAAGGRSEETTTSAENRLETGKRTESVVDGRGYATKINAMIALPREYIAALCALDKAKPAAGAAPGPDVEPTQQEIEAKFKTEKARLEADLSGIITSGIAGVEVDPAAQRVVTVSMIPVPLSLAGLGNFGGGGGGGGQGGLSLASGGGSSGGVMGMLTGDLIKNAVLGTFAVLSVGMMFMLVKKAARPVELPTPESIVGVPPTLEAESDIVGEADESSMAMDGLILDDDEVKNKKMLEQVQEMVKQHPEDAANLLNNWLKADE